MGIKHHISAQKPVLPTIQIILDLFATALGIVAAGQLMSFIDLENLPQIVSMLLTLNYYIASLVIPNNHSWRMRSVAKECFICLRVWSASFLVTIFTINLIDTNSQISVSQVMPYYLLPSLALIFSRMATRFALDLVRSSGRNQKRVAILGHGTIANNLRDTFLRHPWMGVSFRGFYYDKISENGPTASGDPDKLIRLCKTRLIDEVYIALPMREEKTIKRVLNDLSDSSVPVYIIPDLFTFSLLHARWRDIDGIPVVGIYDTPIRGGGAVVKRLEDIVIASAILSLILIPMLIIAIAVKLTSPGPIIFKQKRYGYGGKEVEVWKFRTMTVSENGNNVIQVTKNDPRVTKIGRFLRRSSLDELPQFFNVLQGHMSIVGPRPHAIAHNELYRKNIEGYMLRHLVKPGITGWAQVNGWRGETDTLEKMQRRVEHDLDYIRNWSLNLDIKIIITTIFKGFFGKQAY